MYLYLSCSEALRCATTWTPGTTKTTSNQTAVYWKNGVYTFYMHEMHGKQAKLKLDLIFLDMILRLSNSPVVSPISYLGRARECVCVSMCRESCVSFSGFRIWPEIRQNQFLWHVLLLCIVQFFTSSSSSWSFPSICFVKMMWISNRLFSSMTTSLWSLYRLHCFWEIDGHFVLEHSMVFLTLNLFDLFGP